MDEVCAGIYGQRHICRWIVPQMIYITVGVYPKTPGAEKYPPNEVLTRVALVLEHQANGGQIDHPFATGVVVLNEPNMVSCDRDPCLEEDHDRPRFGKMGVRPANNGSSIAPRATFMAPWILRTTSGHSAMPPLRNCTWNGSRNGRSRAPWA